MRLEIGSGRKPHKGYKTIDIEPYAKPDYLGDFRQMSFSEIEVIRAHHILEHFSREEGIEILKLWRSWLKDDGILIVETPDFEGICENFSKDKYWMTRHAYGSQEAEWAFHKDGWYADKFWDVLPDLGFEITEIRKSVSRKILPNITVIAVKKLPIKQHSQDGEEAIILRYFMGKYGGSLLDIGVNDGKTLSNSYALIQRGWKGVMVEPSPRAFILLQKLYNDNSGVSLFNLALGNYNGETTLYESGAIRLANNKQDNVSLVSTINKEWLPRWKNTKFQSITVSCQTFKTFLQSCPIKQFDFITLDTEGQDWNLLQQMNLGELGCRLICIEHDNEKEIEDYLKYCRYWGFKEIGRTSANLILGL